MGITYNTSMVRSGLVLHLDATNRKSYPGSGNTWTDLSGNGNNGTLTNGPTFSGANGGSLVFDGVDDRVTMASNTIISGTQNFTIEACVRSSAPNTAEYIFGNYGIGNNGLELYFAVNQVRFYWSGVYHNSVFTSITANTWYWISATRNINATSIYINGLLDSNSTNSTSIPTNNPYTIGNGYDYSSEIFIGNIAVVKVYNKALTLTEIQQNFEATRDRYGI